MVVAAVVGFLMHRRTGNTGSRVAVKLNHLQVRLQSPRKGFGGWCLIDISRWQADGSTITFEGDNDRAR